MALDGVLLSAIRHEFADRLLGARVDKFYQPEKKLLTCDLRQPGENIRFAVSIDPETTRLHITDTDFDNPRKPPNFCMVLRKHLINGNITAVKQPNFERIIHIEITRSGKTMSLIMELMGRYSNIILVNPEGKVLDALERITEKISSNRQLYPGITYQSPPPQDKLNPLEVTKDDFFAKIPDDFNGYCYNSLLYNFRGIGPNMAREITYRANIDFEKAYNTLSGEEKNALWQSFRRLFSRVSQGDYNPTIGLDKHGNVDYFSAFPLTFKEIDEGDLIYFDNTGELFDYYYENHIKRRHFIRYSRRLKDTIENYLKKNRKKQYELRQRLKASLNAEKYKKKGELITANIYRLEPGESEIEVEDYYSDDNKTIKIKLDPDLSPSDNAQKYFRKYEKAKKSKKYLKHELGKFRHEERYLENVQHNIEQAETEAELAEIEKELKEEGYIQEQKAGKNSDNKPLPPHKFKSSGGYDILVGRNNHQNDELTTQMANPQDLWLHTKEIAGSHVIVRNHTREDSIPDKTIEEAARLAAYFSKARMSENVPIDYTRVKNVNKPRGAKPGLAYYEEYQTVYVDPMEEDKIRELKVTQDN